METTTHEIQAGNTTLYCVVDRFDTPAILVGDQRALNFPALLIAFPKLHKPELLVAYCQAALTFAARSGLRYIENIPAFQARHKRRSCSAYRMSLEDEGWNHSSTDHGPFDLDAMHEPLVHGHQVTFFAEDDYFGVPYAVTVPYPWDDFRAPTDIRLLPQLTTSEAS